MVGAKFKLKVTLPVDKRWEKKARQLNVDSCQALRITAEFHLDSCQPKSPNKEKLGEKTTFFDFEKKGKNSRNFSFQLFAISEIYILLKKVGSLYIEQKS